MLCVQVRFSLNSFMDNHVLGSTKTPGYFSSQHHHIILKIKSAVRHYISNTTWINEVVYTAYDWQDSTQFSNASIIVSRISFLIERRPSVDSAALDCLHCPCTGVSSRRRPPVDSAVREIRFNFPESVLPGSWRCLVLPTKRYDL